MSKLKRFKDEILYLRKQFKTYPEISTYLKDKYNFNIDRRTICEYVNKLGISDTFETELSNNKFSLPDNWSHGWLKGKHASIFIRNKDGLISFDEMRSKFITEMSEYSPTYKKYKRTEIKDKHLLVIDIADLHIGKLSDY